MKAEGLAIDMHGIVSHRTGEALVQLTFSVGGRKVGGGQLTPTEARTHALKILEVAESAEQDAATLATVQEMLGDDEGLRFGAVVVEKLRARRDPR